MAKLNKIEAARWDGFNRACRIAKEQGVEALLEEQKRRGVSKISVAISDASLKAYSLEVKQACLQTVLLMGSAVLRDEFGFGRDRMSRFIKRFNYKSECLADDYLKWSDLAIQMAAETGIDFELPYFEPTEGKVKE